MPEALKISSIFPGEGGGLDLSLSNVTNNKWLSGDNEELIEGFCLL